MFGVQPLHQSIAAVLARIEAAAMAKHFPSPLMMACGSPKLLDAPPVD
jgi:hypothetical protein